MDGAAAYTLRRAQTVSIVSTSIVALASFVVAGVEAPFPSEGLVPPAALLGLVSPVIGFRAYGWIRERIPSGADAAERCHAFFHATRVAVLLASAISLGGILVYAGSGRPFALVGVLTQVLLLGAVWPSPVRLQAFLDAGDAGDEAR